jgi:hypothetical protein
MDFKTAERQYKVLRKALEAGRITAEEYRALVKRITVFDDQNRRWQLGPVSGEWHRLEGSQWVKDMPPIQPDELPAIAEGEVPAPPVEETTAASQEEFPPSPPQVEADLVDENEPDFKAEADAEAETGPNFVASTDTETEPITETALKEIAEAAPLEQEEAQPAVAEAETPQPGRKKAREKSQKSFVSRFWPLLALAAILLLALLAGGLFILNQFFPLMPTQIAEDTLPEVTPSPQVTQTDRWLPGTWKLSAQDTANDIFYVFAPDGRFVKTSPSLLETQGFGVYRVLENDELLLLFNGAGAESISFEFRDENTLMLHGLRYSRSEESVGAPLATQSAPGELVINTQSLPIYDDFSSLYSGWGQETSPFASYGYEDGQYLISILDKDLLFFPVLRDNSLNAQDVILEINAENASGEETTAAGLICRLNPSGSSFYTFEVSWDGGVFIGKYIDGAWSELARMDEHQSVQRGILPNHLKAVCIGQTLELFVNGTLVLQTRDTSLSSGAPAFFARTGPDQLSAKVLFDDFLAYQP